ncbi:ECF transporter S component [Paratractidigestivibacter sp.]|uniref:ECF transporter S component n=1 Tax=Paratractidigestivibacter sp. TaxID=2847316 RepID=UPI002AC9A3A9|nr:ECF transporter S component [Paratractidigestivibacter sp.]
MAASNAMSHDTHSTTAGAGWSTRRIAVTALFCALSLIASFIEIPIFPPAAWLKYDPSCVIALVAGLAFGPVTGTIVVVLSWLLHLIFAFNPWGVLMAVAANVALVVPCSVIARKVEGPRGLALGMGVGAVVTLAVCVVMNIIVTPLYTAVTTEAVIGMIVPILLPFNVLKVAINCVVTALVQGPVSKVLGK